jgi:hypothetical protein
MRTVTEVLLEHETAVQREKDEERARLEAYIAGLVPLGAARNPDRAQLFREAIQRPDTELRFSGIACDFCRTELVYNITGRNTSFGVRAHTCPGCGERFTLPSHPKTIWEPVPMPETEPAPEPTLEPPKIAFDREFEEKMKDPEFAQTYTETRAEIDAADQEVRRCSSPDETEHLLQQYKLRRFPMLESESIADIEGIDDDLIQH